MTTLLTINSSLFGDAGQSSRLADRFADLWRTRTANSTLIRRDLSREPVPHLTAERFQAFLTAPGQRNDAELAVVEYSDRLIGELRAADVIVLGLPMYNFGVPSTLRSYFDHVARAGVTFRYTANGPEGLLKGKRAFVFSTRGGKHAGTPADTETGYVKQFFRFLGIEDITFVYAEGLSYGEPQKLEALTGATTRIDTLVEPRPLAA